MSLSQNSGNLPPSLFPRDSTNSAQCSINEICKHCLKAARNNVSLAKEICLRDKLQDSYVGVESKVASFPYIDRMSSLTYLAIFGSLKLRKGALAPLLESLSGEIFDITLSVSSSAVGGKGTTFLPLKVRQCDIDPICRWKGLSKVKGIHVTGDSIYAQRYAIVPGSISEVAVEKFAQKVLPLSGSHSGEITQLLDDFLSYYSDQRQSSDLVSAC